jgi:prefoldin subunit 5
MTDAERAELRRLADAVTYLAAQVERLDREIHALQPAPAPAHGWSRAMGS